MANEAIGILFEVQGGGDINKESGRRINGQLRHIVGQINKTDTVKLKFQIDSNHINKQIKQLQKQLSELSSSATFSGGNKSSNNSDTNQQSSAYKDATRAIKEYYSLQAKYDRKSSRTTNASAEYEQLKGALDEATVAFRKYVDEAESGTIRAKKNIEGLSESQIRSLDELIKAQDVQYQTNKIDVDKNAEQAWSNLTQKVHDYIDRVEFAASRDKDAADGLKRLRELANNTDYHGYDELKKKLAEVQQYINENSLATETWGQKMIKTFGSRVRSALAGIITAKIGQYIKEVYDNVVELDKALVNLQIATGKNREETKALIKEYANLAKQMGATTIEVAEAADTWLRQGYSTEEANTLITNSMMLAKLGQMESAEASTALTSAMKGYGVSVQNSIGIIDKFTKVDMEAAASAGDIATAMSETAASANAAGVSMDTLIGYLAVVKEVTQDGAESVGTFYKTLFARMNNVAAGNFVDEETGESLNDVETVLNKLGIALRDTNGQFRTSSEVLDEVADRWETFDSVQQHAIATAMAGTRQQEKFLVLMQNYETAMEYAATATKSAGTATEKFGAYTEGVEGKLNTLTATFEELSVSVLNSDLVAFFLDTITNLISALDAIMSFGDGVVVTAALATLAIVGLIAASNALGDQLSKVFGGALTGWGDFVAAIQLGSGEIGAALKSLISNPYLYLVLLITTFSTFSDKMPAWSLVIVGAILAIGTAVAIACSTANAAVYGFMARNPLGWILLAITAIVVAITSVVKGLAAFANATTQAKEEAVANAKESKEALEEVEEELDALNEKLDESKDRLKELQALSNSGTITLVEQQEMDKLSSTITKLEAEKALLEDIAKMKRQDAEQDAASAIDAIMAERLSDAFTQEDNTFWNGVGRSLASVFSLGLSDWIAGYGISDWTKPPGASAAQGKHYTTAEEYVNEILGNWEGATEQQRNYVIDFYNQLSEQKDMLSYHSGENLAQWQKDCNDAYNTYYEFAHKMLIAQGNFDTAWNSIVTMERFDGIHGYLTGVAEQGTLTSGNLRSLYDSNSQFKEFVDYLIDIGFFAWNDQAKIGALVNQINAMSTGAQKAKREAKTFIEILNDVQGAYDVLSGAMEDMNEYGYVSADTLSTLLEEFPYLEKYLTLTANGYILASDALEDYIKAQRDAYVLAVIMADEGTNAYEVAYHELERFLAVIATLELSKAIEEETEALEAEKDAWEDQLDKYKELIDIRKELLNTYAEELEYQKELEKKQRNVSNLQTKLSLARLDTSAAGQARVRELETELKEAQEELEDFTLEHAIDVLTNQLDNQYKQYENLVESKVSEITSAINSVSSTIRENAKNFEDQVKQLIDQYNVEHNVNDIAGGAVGGAINGAVQGTYAQWESYWFSQNPGVYGPPPPMPDGWTMPEKYGTYDMWESYWYSQNPGVYGPPPPMPNGWVPPDEWYKKYTSQSPTYHSGGFVGGDTTISSNEEFAKLLKGEFVTTPAQMKRFMERTLPQITSYSTTNGKNEFNAPLVEITCESVTTESLPKLERIVNEAVKEVQRQLDNGMSRTGFKQPRIKRLTV